jgi:hypothetical protein
LLAVSLFVAPGSAAGQSVVPPGAAYVESPEDAASASSARWLTPPEGPRVLRVAFASPPGGRSSFWDAARRALDVWAAVPDLPVRFRITAATDSADIEFRWIDRFPTSQAGAAHRRLDADGYIRHVVVVLAREHADGSPMSAEFRRLVALHEVGHALGLPHSDDPGDVMHPGNRNFTVSPRDLRSLGAVYASDPASETPGG